MFDSDSDVVSVVRIVQRHNRLVLRSDDRSVLPCELVHSLFLRLRGVWVRAMHSARRSVDGLTLVRIPDRDLGDPDDLIFLCIFQ